MKTNLPQVTVVIVDTINYGLALHAINKTLEQIEPAQTLFFTDVIQFGEGFKTIVIPRIKSKEEYSYFIVKELAAYIRTDYVLIIQHDGYVLDGKAWNPDFLEYDYIGAPWHYQDGRNVGNGGFSLRSKKLQEALASDDDIEITSPEDEIICRLYRNYLEKNYKIKFAPEELAHSFSFEVHKPTKSTFGFHNNFHTPFKEPIIVKRTGAMGDVIMMEPVLEYFHKQGYRVILDTRAAYFNLFMNHHYPIELLGHVLHEDLSSARVINLDMAYEVKPRKLALKAYYESCGVEDGDIRNAKLNFKPTDDVKLFNKYIVLHTDDTAMPHRNVHDVDWGYLTKALELLGYGVYRIGNGNGSGGRKINTVSENMMAYIISGADYFIGIDSGPSQIAVACGVKSIIFFGSVNPKYRYADLSNIMVIQNHCPINKDGCYHDQVSVSGKDCEVNKNTPPCITHKTVDILTAIQNYIK